MNMKNEETTPSQVGLYNLPKGMSNAGNKVLKVFNKLKRRTKQMVAEFN